VPEGSVGDRWRVFLSSTFKELADYRQEIRERCARELGDQIEMVALDDAEYPKLLGDGKTLSVEEVKSCDLVLLFMGRELGSRSSTGESYTEAEIRTAQQNGIQIITFLVDESGRGPRQERSASPSPGDREWWNQERQRLFRLAVYASGTIVGRPDVLLREASQLADEVIRVLRGWLEFNARPHCLRGTNQSDRVFIDREEPYRKLKRRVLQGQDSVVSGPSGTGKSTLTKALSSDYDVARSFALPAIELSVDLSVPHSEGNQSFRQRVDKELADRGKPAPGMGYLVVVTMSSVLGGGTREDGARNVADFIGSFSGDEPLPQHCTTLFEVAERSAGGWICQYLDLVAAQAHIVLPDLPLEAAIDLLVALKGLHYQCAECERLGPSVAAAAGCWPPLLAVCARTFDEQGHWDDQHGYLRNADRAFGELRPGQEPMYYTFLAQMKLLPDDARDLLQAAGVLLPQPFAFSPDLIQEVSGLSEQATKQALRTLVDRRYIERAGRPEHADDEMKPEYTLHTFFWVFLKQQHEAALSAGGPAGLRLNGSRSAAFSWLDQEMNDTVDDALTYLGWYQLEKPERQNLIANWIYQLAYLDDKRRAAEELVHIFLKAHYWWGYYVSFSFCELLIELGNKAVDWSSPADGDDLSVIAQALRTVHDKYPRHGQFDEPPDATVARKAWSATRQALLDIAMQLEIPLDNDVPAMRRWVKASVAGTDNRQAKTRAEIALFLSAFLAFCECCLYGELVLDDKRLRETERYCKSALAIANELEDDWNPPWILAQQLGDAELNAARARRQSPAAFRRTEAACVKKARAYAEKAFRLARRQAKDVEGVDFEILSLCERLLGDIDWHVGSQEAAVEHYVRAIHYAHCFEVWPEHQPDRYTWTFEREQRWRVSTPLLELADAGDDSALRRLSGQIAGFFGTDPSAAWQQVTAAAARENRPPGTTVNGLFAPYNLPPADELERRDESGQRLIDQFRGEATRMIRATELRHPDLTPLPGTR
jgi:Domain of unknown function (DUF4062)